MFKVLSNKTSFVKKKKTQTLQSQATKPPRYFGLVTLLHASKSISIGADWGAGAALWESRTYSLIWEVVIHTGDPNKKP
jgi:hypothetical protein